MTIRRVAIPFLLNILLLGGCASTTQVRGLATQTGAAVQTLSSSTAAFLTQQNTLNASNATRLATMAQDTSRLRQNSNQQQFAWVDSGDQVRTATYQRATAASASDIVSSLSVRPVQLGAISSDVTGSYDKTTKALAVVATKPKFLAEVRELASFAEAVSDAYAKLQDAATSEAAATNNSSSALDTASTSAGAVAASPSP